MTVAITPADVSAMKYIDVKGCAARYGFSWRHWLRLVDSGRAPRPTRFGRLVRWAVSSLESWEATGCPSCRKGVGR
jgi:predicted DNA-binding transcriptional regulator AlpA